MYVAADKWINDGGHRQIVATIKCSLSRVNMITI